MPTNDKIIALASLGDKGLAAAFVYNCSLAHSGAHETGGFIRKGALPFIHGKPAHARLLAEHHLWIIVEGGWQIKNYGERNAVGAGEQAKADARSAASSRAADIRWGKDIEK